MTARLGDDWEAQLHGRDVKSVYENWLKSSKDRAGDKKDETPTRTREDWSKFVSDMTARFGENWQETLKAQHGVSERDMWERWIAGQKKDEPKRERQPEVSQEEHAANRAQFVSDMTAKFGENWQDGLKEHGMDVGAAWERWIAGQKKQAPEYMASKEEIEEKKSKFAQV